MTMKPIIWLKQLLDYLGGAVETPPVGTSWILSTSVFRGIWWGLLLVVVMLFSGQTSKFIYIDF
jgi:hypothetical protein